ncbi:MAG: alpha/beta hydrolase [Wenzhouxiangella sp.]|nr:alpha/beta hydrolase [Wenzhouxiangella sp.]MCH8479510.1 alpha/beta hydrolase [Wenzhouxiangella sp.]TVR91674.1 MAG: alpha/beta hydrolase [Wenzhouxiangellaceae bacterium]
MLRFFKLLLLGLLVLLGFIVLALPWLLPTPGLDGRIPEQPFPDSGFERIDGTNLHYRARLNLVSREADNSAEGQHPLVILLHGFGGSTFSWNATLDALEAEAYPVIAIDLPPFGYSERRGSGAEWAALVAGLVDRLAPGHERVWVGHSMGASVAAAAAAKDPERSQHLVIVAGWPERRNRGSRLRPGLMATVPSIGRWVEVIAAHRMVDEDRIRSMLASAFGRAPSEEEFQGYFHPLTIPGTATALQRRFDTENQSSSEGWQAVPTTMIWGEEDRWVPLSVGQRLLADHPDLRLKIIERTGHNPMETEPERFQALLLEAIRGD